jgi:hypothetical protein
MTTKQTGWWNRVPKGTEITLIRNISKMDAHPNVRHLPQPKFGSVYIFAGVSPKFIKRARIKVIGFPELAFWADFWRPLEYDLDFDVFEKSAPKPDKEFMELCHEILNNAKV